MLCVCCMEFTQAKQAVREEKTESALKLKTGWIRLGSVTVNRKRWAGASDPNVDFPTGGFEILEKNVDRRKVSLPMAKDRIRLTAANEVIVLDYVSSGEKRALDSPASLTRSIGDRDRPGIRLAAGTIVQVEEIRFSRP